MLLEVCLSSCTNEFWLFLGILKSMFLPSLEASYSVDSDLRRVFISMQLLLSETVSSLFSSLLEALASTVMLSSGSWSSIRAANWGCDCSIFEYWRRRFVSIPFVFVMSCWWTWRFESPLIALSSAFEAPSVISDNTTVTILLREAPLHFTWCDFKMFLR